MNDWVTKRAACTLPNMFRTIRLRVEEDVKNRNALRPSNSPYEFLVTEGDDEFTVNLKTEGTWKSVVFSLTERAILVRDDKRIQMFEITLTFNDQGECRLSADHVHRELWQIERLALEELFF